MQALFEVLKGSKESPGICVLVDLENNKRAVRFYEKCGFKAFGRKSKGLC